MKPGDKIGPTIVDRTYLRVPVHVSGEIVELGHVRPRPYVRLVVESLGEPQPPSTINLAVANLTMAQARELYEQLAAAVDAFEQTIHAGDLVEVAIDLDPVSPALPSPYPVVRGDRGRVARIIHCRVEGEPVREPTVNPIVHVRFANHTAVVAFAPACLRVVEDEQP
jgi:hypothetical protein